MKRTDQYKLFMAFYGVTERMKAWARAKWRSGTMSLSPESLEYMTLELERRAEHARQIKIMNEELRRESKHAAATPNDDNSSVKRGKRPTKRSKLRRAAVKASAKGEGAGDTIARAICGQDGQTAAGQAGPEATQGDETARSPHEVDI